MGEKGRGGKTISGLFNGLPWLTWIKGMEGRESEGRKKEEGLKARAENNSVFVVVTLSASFCLAAAS